MKTSKGFEDWLKRNLPSSAKNYLYGFNSINRLIDKLGYDSLYENMSLSEFDNVKHILSNSPQFIDMNKKGNNMYSATMTNFRLFLETSDTNTRIPNLVKPFEEFGWRWATTGIVSYLNEPKYLKCVLDSILINGNGKDNQTIEFKNLVQKIGENKYNLAETDAKKISKLDNTDQVKNIIENSANYWYNLGLLKNTGRSAEVSEIGIKYSKGEISDLDFVKFTIENYNIPSNTYPPDERSKFETFKIKIRPLKIIIDILIALQSYENNNYLVKEDLSNIIVPLSIEYGEDNIDIFVYHILNHRINPNQYSFPDCISHYTDDKGIRMLNEYLYFLECYGILTSDSNTANSNGKKYYLNSNLINEIGYNLTKFECKGFNKIYYGPPGTGKSHRIKKYLKDKGIDKDHYTRITFHPDYDYASFVGAYKPNMIECEESKVSDEREIENKKNTTIQYSFVPQVFTNIYLKASQKPNEDFYLVIEEINRGNCAEIFGDLFQLLDRDPEYDIEPSQELYSYIKKVNSSALIDGKMRLPDNLYILASMNTSDQSLFPMDSAFKRRWDWEYVKIDYNCTESNFIINVSNTSNYRWLDFLKAINDVIFETTKSEDKQIGNWFVKGEKVEDNIYHKGIITRDKFINKVVFYLWNDIFKDEMNDLFKDKDGNDINLSHFFQSEEELKKGNEDLLETLLGNNLKLIPLTIDTE